jgi:hypothetical protein
MRAAAASTSATVTGSASVATSDPNPAVWYAWTR